MDRKSKKYKVEVHDLAPSRDAKGGDPVSGIVHVQSDYTNAFWNGTSMNYGDGDGRTFAPLTTLDIAGHEISHGLTERTAFGFGST